MITIGKVVVAMDGVAWGRVLRSAAVAMVVSTAAAIAGQVIYVLSVRGGSTGDRLELVSQVATPALGVLVLGAALLLLGRLRAVEPDEPHTSADWVAVAVVVLGAVITFAAAYSIVHTVSLHVPSPGATGQDVQLRFSSSDWSTKIGEILIRAAGGVLGAWAAWTAMTMLVLPARSARRPSV